MNVQNCVDFALLHGPPGDENLEPLVYVPTPEEILTNSLCVERESFFDLFGPYIHIY